MENKQTTPTSTQETTSPIINLSEKELTDIGTETIKYSIRTMAQDLERAKKEGASLTAAKIKPPTIPPPPPPKITTPQPTPVAPTPIKPTTVTPPPAIKPAIEPTLKAPAITPIPPTPSLKKEFAAPIPPPIPRPAAVPTIAKEVPPPAGLPIAPKPSITAAIPPSAIPTAPAIKPISIPTPKKFLLPSIPQLNLVITIIIIIIILFGSIGFSYWLFFVKPAPIVEQQPTEQITPTENIPPVVEEPTLPEKISQTDADIIIETSSKIASPETTSALLNQISSSAKQLSNKQLGRILIKYSTDTEKSYLTFPESSLLLQVTIPEGIKNNIQTGELLAYNQDGQFRYGFATTISNTLSMIDAMKNWEKTIIDDVTNLYIGSYPTKPQNISFNDDFQDNFIIRYLNLPTSSLSIAWAESNEKQIFIVATSKDMTYKIIGVKEIKSALKTYPSGTLVKSKSDNKIYRIIDDKKLWIPTIKAFLDSGYKPYSEIEITPEELNNFENVKYVKSNIDKNVYELKNDKKYLAPDISSLPQQEIKIVTPAELNAYPLGK